MSKVYVITTAAGLAGIAIGFAWGLRFGAADDRYGPLEGERWQRIEDLCAAVDRLAAPGECARVAVESWPLVAGGRSAAANAIPEEVRKAAIPRRRSLQEDRGRIATNPVTPWLIILT
jgi:hypothetical protein